MFLFSGRGKEHSKEENKNCRRRGKRKISKTKMNVSILTSVVLLNCQSPHTVYIQNAAVVFQHCYIALS